MTYTTTIHDLPAPTQLTPGTGPDIPKDFKELADAIDTKLAPFSKGLLSGRPAFGKTGQTYLATDNGHLYLDIGTAWADRGVALTTGSVGTNELADDAVTVDKIADNSVPNAALLDNSVGPSELQNSSVTASKVADALKPSAGAAAATESLRALGITSGTAAAGTDSRLSDQRVPTDGSVSVAKLAVAVLNLLVPIGAILDYGGSTAPAANWLICDGSSVLRATYPELFAVIGTTFGSADGTHFNLPPAGRVYVGKSADTEFDTLGETGGEKKHQLTEAELAVHDHASAFGSNLGLGQDAYRVGTHDFDTGTAVHNAGGDVPHNNLQPYVVVNKIVRAS